MEEIKDFLKMNCKIPFLVRKNTNKYYKGYSHVIYIKYVYRVEGLEEMLSELGYAHSPYLAEGGSYSVRMYIKKISDQPLPETPEGMYLWLCPECGNPYYIKRAEKYKINIFTFHRTVCNNCKIGEHMRYSAFRGRCLRYTYQKNKSYAERLDFLHSSYSFLIKQIFWATKDAAFLQ